MAGRRAGRVTNVVPTAEALIARIGQQQQTINDLKTLARNLANMLTAQQSDSGDAEVDLPPAA